MSEGITYDPLKEKCNKYSPAFPSAGGPGCRLKCSPKDGKNTFTFSAGFYESTHSWPEDLLKNMRLAWSILKKYGSPRSGQVDFHLAFDYYCCYTEDEAMKIGQFLNSYTWRPQKVWFDKMECAIHGYGDMVSFVLMVDKKSQTSLLKWTLTNEHDLEIRTNINKHVPHTNIQDFHMTLGTVNQIEFPVKPALSEINTVIKPSSWHRMPIILQKPLCKKYKKILSAQKKKKKQIL